MERAKADGVTCPKCGHTPEDPGRGAATRECCRCGVVFEKFSGTARRADVRADRHSTATAPPSTPPVPSSLGRVRRAIHAVNPWADAGALGRYRALLAAYLFWAWVLGSLLWVGTLITLDVAPALGVGQLGPAEQLTFREAFVLFVFGGAAVAVGTVAAFFVGTFGLNLLRDRMKETVSPSWYPVVRSCLLLASLIPAFALLPSIKREGLAVYEQILILSEKSGKPEIKSIEIDPDKLLLPDGEGR